MRPLPKALSILAIAATLIGVAALWQVHRFLNSAVVVPEEGASFEIAPGTPFARISAQLAQEGIIANPTLMRI